MVGEKWLVGIGSTMEGDKFKGLDLDRTLGDVASSNTSVKLGEAASEACRKR
jgi:hypothetical protein